MDSSRELVETIKKDYESGQLQLPSLPDIAFQVRRAVEDENKSAADIARIIQFDPAMTARLIQVANSSLYRGFSQVETAQDAIARIGMSKMRDLIFSLSLQNVFNTRNPELSRRMKRLWKHSVRVAAISRVLGRIGPDLNADRALLAGLVHDIGTIPVLSYSEMYPDLLANPQQLDALIKQLRGKLGVMVLKSWDFDPKLVRVPLEVENYLRNPDVMPDYADVAMLANIFSLFGSSDEAYDGPPAGELPAFGKFPLMALGPEGGLEILEEARDEISEVMSVFQAS